MYDASLAELVNSLEPDEVRAEDPAQRQDELQDDGGNAKTVPAKKVSGNGPSAGSKYPLTILGKKPAKGNAKKRSSSSDIYAVIDDTSLSQQEKRQKLLDRNAMNQMCHNTRARISGMKRASGASSSAAKDEPVEAQVDDDDDGGEDVL
eukprot:6464956-Amphidinium_carterae.1